MSLGNPLGYLLDYQNPWSNAIQLIEEISPGSNVRYHDLMGYPPRATLALLPLGYCPKFPPTPSDTCLTYPSRSTHAVTLSGGWPTIPWRRGRSRHFLEAKGNNKLDNKLEFLVVLGAFFSSTLSLWHVIIFSNYLVTLPAWDLINILDGGSFLSPNFASSAQQSHTHFSESLPPWRGSAIWELCLGTLFNYIL